MLGAQKDDPNQDNYDPIGFAHGEGPPRRMALVPFFLGKHELTQGQWRRLTQDETPSSFRAGESYQGNPGKITERHPVETVDWFDCHRWLTRHGLALPTEAQWEYGCRAGTTTPWSTGPEPDSLKGYANVFDRHAESVFPLPGLCDVGFRDGYAVTAPVGTYRGNAWGLFDMHGNVLEWCQSEWASYALPDGLRLLASVHCVQRGGAYDHNARDSRSVFRFSTVPGARSTNTGVRAARAVSLDATASRPAQPR
jgi:formylglycine-generating enzyme required for sulfatase activity